MLWGLLVSLHSVSGFASGWNDYTFDIDSKYMLLRANAEDIHIWRKDPVGAGIHEVTEVTLKDGNPVGPIENLSIGKDFIFAKCRGTVNLRGSASEKKAWYFIIARRNDKVYGPDERKEFDADLKQLGLREPVWQPLRQAYKQALREGRADAKQPLIALTGQLMFLVIALPFLLAKYLIPLLISP